MLIKQVNTYIKVAFDKRVEETRFPTSVISHH